MLLSYFDNKKSDQVILFIHGTASTNEVWDKQYSLLSESHYRVIGIDLRGHGRSENPGGACTTEDHINDLKETIEHIGIESPIIMVGHSFGAVLALRFAEKYPALVAKLLLISLPARIPKLLQKYYRWLLGKPIEILKNKINLILKLPLKKRYKVAITSDISVVRGIWRDSLKWDFLASTPKLQCPVYFSVGRFDYVASSHLVRKLHGELPNSNYTVFKWSSHTCMEDEPNEFNKWIISALSLPILKYRPS